MKSRVCVDIQYMPGYNPAVTNGVDSMTKRLVGFGWPRFPSWKHPAAGLNDAEIGVDAHPYCIRHGALLRVSKDGIYRCGELGCDNGCYCP